MQKIPYKKEDIVKEAYLTYLEAREEKKFTAALKAVELLAKILGIEKRDSSKRLSIKDLSDEEVELMINELKQEADHDS